MRGKVTAGYHSEPCEVRIKNEWRRAEFLGIFQEVGNNLKLNQLYARPVAVVKICGRIGCKALSEVKFAKEATDET